MSKKIENPARCEVRAVINFYHAKNVSPAEIFREICEVYGEHVISEALVRSWCRMFDEGTNVHDEDPALVTADLIGQDLWGVPVKEEPELETESNHSGSLEDVAWESVVVKEERVSEFSSVENVKQEWPQDVEDLSDDVLAPKVELTIEQHSITLGSESPDEDESHPGSCNADETSGPFLSGGVSGWCNQPSAVEACIPKQKSKKSKNTSLTEQSFICEQCGRSFTRRSTLVQHLRMHSDDIALKCKECGKEFSRRNNLKDHMRMHSGEKNFKCEECGKCFVHDASRRKHMKIHSKPS